MSEPRKFGRTMKTARGKYYRVLFDDPGVLTGDQPAARDQAVAEALAQQQAARESNLESLQAIESRPLATPETIGTLARILRELLEETSDPQS